MKKIFTLILALSMLAACFGMGSVYAEPGLPAMANGADANPNNAILLNEGEFYAVHFNTTAAFNGVRVPQWTPGNGEGSVDWTLAVYAWNKDMNTSRKGTPVAEKTGNITRDDLNYEILFDKPVPAGNYVVEFTATAVNDVTADLGGIHLKTGVLYEGKEDCFEWDTDSIQYVVDGSRAAAFLLVTGDSSDDSVFIGLDEENPNAGKPSEPSEPEKPAEKPYVEWSEYGKGNALSCDTIYVNDGESRVDNVEDGAPNLVAWMTAHDNTIDGSDSSISTLYPKGWIGLDQKIAAIGYSIDDGAPVYPDNVMADAEDPVKTAGGEFAVRFKLPIDVSKLSGKHTIVMVVKLEDGTVVAATYPGQPISFTYQGPEAKTPDVPTTADTTAPVLLLAAAAIVVTVLLKKRAF